MTKLRLFWSLYRLYYAVTVVGGIGRHLNALRLACWCMADIRSRRRDN